MVWHIVFYGVDFGAVLEWRGLAYCILWERVWNSLGVVWFGILYSMGRVWSSLGVVWFGTLYSMGYSLEQSWSGLVWHIVFYGVDFGAVLVWFGILYSMG